MIAAEAVGRALAGLGVTTVFGVAGSGNFHVTNALVAGGARFVAARHEGGAATMADAYARVSGRPGLLSVHQGPGLTNAITGIAEAAKSRTPLLVLAGEAGDPRSNFAIDQDALAAAVGAVPMRAHSGETAVDDAIRAYRTAVRERRTVLLNLPLNVQNEMAKTPPSAGAALVPEAAAVPAPPPETIARLGELLLAARRPVFIAGRGARGARAELTALADRVGALLATSAVAKGLFRGDPWDLDVSGGFATRWPRS
ncbi:thiamine pyrophosphate-binding protein [Thermocatellispora tengchongensis]|uniref:thiamine pyrophosphate-binding protein n=1 Tax=Thermocatellispora tengchongensis TaxID=1073253 RepID=UPI00362BA249